MKTEQINIRLEPDLVAALERVAREEALDRGTAVRRLLEASLRQWEVERALRGYQRGELSIGRAAEEAGLTQWELLDAARRAGIAYPLDMDEVEQRLALIASSKEGGAFRTLPDLPPERGGVLLVGINPAPISVAAGHYYQGRLGRRLWKRLQRVGLLKDPVPGAEDEAFVSAGNGLTDLVKRPTASSTELAGEELAEGVDSLRAKIREWRPRLILFPFKEPARRLLGDVSPGPCGQVEGVPTFLLSGPYAPRAEADRIDGQLANLLGRASDTQISEADRSRPVTPNDLERGQIRFPRTAKRFFPSDKAVVDVVVRGTRIQAAYDPRTGPDRDRSATLHVGKPLSGLVKSNELLRVSRGPGGVVRLD